MALAAAGPACAVEVREVRWGFDGRAVPERVNVLSVLIADESGKGFEGEAALERDTGVGGRAGAVLAQPCYVAPYTERRLQFYPYVSEDDEQWRLRLGRTVVELPRVGLAAPAAVYLCGPDVTASSAGLRAFPEMLFPPTVAGTDGLCAVVLDHAPRWEPARREAFVDWLRRGGTAVLLQDETGHHPGFTAELSVLNGSGRSWSVGAGRVVRLDMPRGRCGPEDLAGQGVPRPALERSDGPSLWALDEFLLTGLNLAVQPEHSWALIYLALIAYVLLVGPANWLIGRLRRDFRPAMGFLVACVVAFAVLVSMLGRRGYGETATVHSVSYARPLGDGAYDVTQWTNAFVVRGAYYDITHRAGHNIYATCGTQEAVNGVIYSGSGGRFLVDIPLFSSRGFLHRAKMQGPDLGLRVLEWSADDVRLDRLALGVGPDFPAEMETAYVCYRGTFYLMWRDGDRLVKAERNGTPGGAFLAADRLQDRWNPWGLYGREGRRPGVEEVFASALRPLIARSMGGAEAFRYSYPDASHDPGCVQLFIYAAAPASFGEASGKLGREVGRVLYHVDVRKPEDTNG
jgi:hypothetical protein